MEERTMKNKYITALLIVIPLLPVLILLPSFSNNQPNSNHLDQNLTLASVNIDGVLSTNEKESIVKVYRDEIFELYVVHGMLNDEETSSQFSTDKGLWLGLERKNTPLNSTNDLIYYIFDLDSNGLEHGKDLVIRLSSNSSLNGIGVYNEYWQITSDFSDIKGPLPLLSEFSFHSNGSLFVETFISEIAFSIDLTNSEFSFTFCIFLTDYNMLVFPRDMNIYDNSTYITLN